MDFKPYPTYKDSGVPWLGEVPAHWEMERGKWLFRKMNRPIRDADEVVTCFRDGIVTLRKNRRVRGFTESLKEIGYQGIRRGDLVIHGMDAFAGAIGVADSDGKGTPVYSVCKPGLTANAPYYAYALREMARSQWIQALAKGIRERSTDFRFEGFGSQPVPLPPRTEQAAIVRFLDYADRRIRRYIRAKQKLVTLLEEQKQALIHQAVTGQIDVRTGQPYPAYKPSGVEWLGDVPEHWEVVPLKRIAWFKSGAGFPVAEQGRQDSEIPFLKVSDMTRPGNEVWIEMTGSSVSSATATRLGAFVFPAGSIIFPKVGGALLTNKRRLLRRPSCVDNNVMGCVVSEADLNYAFILLQQLDLGRLAKPGPVPAIGEGEVRAIKVVLPPTQEQVELVTFVHHETANLDSVILTTKRETTLLREYRTRLIADVVTGKLDVRAAAARLPDEAEEPEPRDETNALTEGEEEPTDDLDTTPEEAAV